ARPVERGAEPDRASQRQLVSRPLKETTKGNTGHACAPTARRGPLHRESHPDEVNSSVRPKMLWRRMHESCEPVPQAALAYFTLILRRELSSDRFIPCKDSTNPLF